MIKDHSSAALESFALVVEKLAKNKLNKSNAFENRIIDSIKLVIDEENQGLDGVWQVYTTGIESCGKVYGYCVDQVYSETIQILAGLNRSVGEQESKENLKDLSESWTNKAKKKTVWNTGTLETEEKNINVDRIEGIDAIDGFLKMLTGKFDSNTYAGLMLNSFFVDENLNFTVLDQENKEVSTENEDFELEYEIGVNEIRVDFEIFNGVKKFLPNKNEESLDRVLEGIEQGNDLFENSVSEESAPGDIEENDNFEDIVEIGEFKAVQKAQFSMTIDERLSKIEELDDYQFVKTHKNNWAGLEYWKKQPKPLLEKTKKAKSQSTLVLKLNPSISKSQLFEPCKKGTTNYFSASAHKSQDPTLTLPEDYNFSIKRLTQLFTRPQACVRLEKKTEKNVLIESNLQELEENEEIFVDQAEVEENFVIQFATTSKTVDIRQLKENIWGCLGVRGNNKENFCREEKRPSFLRIVEQLPKLVSKSDLENLSVHSCFIAVLHLANEKNLILKSNGECDFLIE